MIMIPPPLGAHRALPDVLAMERVILHPSLLVCLSNVLTRCRRRTRSIFLFYCLLYQPLFSEPTK